MIKLAVEDGGAGSTIDSSYATNSATLQGHPGAIGAAAVGAAAFYSTPSCGTSPAQLEYFSSFGGAPILFNTNGTAITPETRQKPDFVGPDGVNNTFLGFTLAGAAFLTPPPSASALTMRAIRISSALRRPRRMRPRLRR